MKAFAVRVIAMALFGAVAFTGLDAPPVAATPAQTEKFAGTYRVHVNWHDSGYHTFSMVLLGNETGTDSFGNQIRWSHIGRQFSFYSFDLNETFFAHGTGVRNRNGFNSRKNPGTIELSTLFTDTGVWYAVKIRPASGAGG
jgi:hypothetical protein